MSAINLSRNPGSNPVPISVDDFGSKSKKRRRRSWLGFIRDICLYIGVYVLVSGLSIGPLFWVWFGAVYVDGPKWFARLYLPLAILCDLIPPLGWLIDAWISWWIF